MDQLTRSNRHRAEVIEIYENGLRAAVRFTSGRIECVTRRGMTPDFRIGMRGTVDYVRALNGYEWTFIPFKSESTRPNERKPVLMPCGHATNDDCLCA